MGNAISGEEWDERLESARRSRLSHSDFSRARPPAESKSESESESDDWEVLGAEATAQTPSQQYYPPPLSVRLEAAARRREEHDRLRARAGDAVPVRQSVHPSWRQPVRQPVRQSERQPVGWRQVGMALAVAGAACIEVLAENQRAKEDAKQQLAKKGEGETKKGEGETKNGEGETKKGEKNKTEEVEEAEESLENAEESEQEFAPSAPPAALPEICPHHPGCTAPACDRLHLCRLFLADRCPQDIRCPRGHSLTTVHNQRVCDRYGLDTGSSDQCIGLLRTGCRERPDSFQPPLQPAQLSICFMQHICGGSCNRLHLCRGWVTGDCTRTVCKFGHDPLTTHNMAVLERHGLLQADPRTIGRLLANKYTARPAQGTTAAASQGATAAVSPLSDELQCAVCLDLFHSATTLGCGHTFCASCVRDVRLCPMCRAAVTTSSRSVTLDSIVSSVRAGGGGERM